MTINTSNVECNYIQNSLETSPSFYSSPSPESVKAADIFSNQVQDLPPSSPLGLKHKVIAISIVALGIGATIMTGKVAIIIVASLIASTILLIAFAPKIKADLEAKRKKIELEMQQNEVQKEERKQKIETHFQEMITAIDRKQWANFGISLHNLYSYLDELCKSDSLSSSCKYLINAQKKEVEKIVLKTNLYINQPEDKLKAFKQELTEAIEKIKEVATL